MGVNTGQASALRIPLQASYIAAMLVEVTVPELLHVAVLGYEFDY